jgi:hypothetical protein
MPAYPGNGLATLLSYTKQGIFWQGETVPVAAAQGSLSVAFQLQRVDSAFYPWGFAVEVQFSGAPGTFEIDVMGAETDNGAPLPGNYVKIGMINAVNASNVGRFETMALYPKYVALYVATLPNAVTITAKISR